MYSRKLVTNSLSNKEVNKLADPISTVATDIAKVEAPIAKIQQMENEAVTVEHELNTLGGADIQVGTTHVKVSTLVGDVERWVVHFFRHGITHGSAVIKSGTTIQIPSGATKVQVEVATTTDPKVGTATANPSSAVPATAPTTASADTASTETSSTSPTPNQVP